MQVIDFALPAAASPAKAGSEKSWETKSTREYNWDEEVKSLHLVSPPDFKGTINLQVRHMGTEIVRNYIIGEGRLSRVIVSRSTGEESGIEVTWDSETKVSFMPVLDRAHFPTSEVVEEVR